MWILVMKNIYHPIHFSPRVKKKRKKKSLPCHIFQTLVMRNHLLFLSGLRPLWLYLTEIPCEAFTVDNAELDPDDDTFEYEDTVLVTCDDGYVLSGGTSTTATATCTACGTWDAIPSCSGKHCTLYSCNLHFLRSHKNTALNHAP